MKALTLTQPWATLVAIGAKRIETRSWRTDYRGPLAIHAAAGLGPVGGVRGLAKQCDQEEFFRAFVTAGMTTRSSTLESLVAQIPRGAIVATCWLAGCMPTAELVEARQIFHRSVGADDHPQFWNMTYQERAFGDYSAGRFAWLLTDVQTIPEPIPARGALGLWEWEGSI